MVAPISQDNGGSYTTGVCKVVESLMAQKYSDAKLYLSSTNISDEKAKKLCKYQNQYNGYKYLLLYAIKEVILHPLRFIREFEFYMQDCHVNPLRFFFYRLNIERHIKRINPDIIHVHTTESPAVNIANKHSIPTIVTMHGFFYRGESDKTKLDFLYNSTRNFNVFTGLTTECQKLMSKYLEIDKNKIQIIPNGIDTSKFIFDKSEREILREKFNASDSIIFITVGSLQSRKGQLEFIKILENLNFNWKYWIIGTGPDKTRILEYCEEKGFTDKVTLLGHIGSDDLYKYYSAADVYAHTSKMEGQALSEMEAYATGLRIAVNKCLQETIATDVYRKDIYYLMDMENIEFKSFNSWLFMNTRERETRKGIDWQEIADQYNKLYKQVTIINHEY